MASKHSTSEIVLLLEERFPEKFLYDKTHFLKLDSKICITCPKHGDFWETPRKLFKSQFGCPQCAKEHSNKPLEEQNFLKKAIEMYPKYDYRKVEYIKGNKNVIVICPEHGEFLVSPNNLLKGLGCPLCEDTPLVREKNNLFINKSNLVHNFKYDYSDTHYIDNRTKVTITCPEHGKFEQNPSNHLKGCGCSKCKSSKGETTVANFLRENNIDYIPQYKIKLDNCSLFADFYFIFQGNLYIIEYNGEQHYRPIKFFGGEESFTKLIARDNLLKLYCLINEINLIELNKQDNILEKLKFLSR